MEIRKVLKNYKKYLASIKKFIPLNLNCTISLFFNETYFKNMEDKINSTKFEKPNFEIICNVSTNPENNPENLRKLLIEQIYSHEMERKHYKYVKLQY